MHGYRLIFLQIYIIAFFKCSLLLYCIVKAVHFYLFKLITAVHDFYLPFNFSKWKCPLLQTELR